jgi:CBS domain-containing protein
MWWPAIGGLVIGIGGLIFPQALGVGYDTIGALLQGQATTGIILGILLVKSTIWAVSLGSGTSGGVLAPLLFLPLLVAAIIADGFTVLVMRRSILTEKVSRRGFHLSREYSVDPLEILFVREAMHSQVVSIPADTPLADLVAPLQDDDRLRRQALYPVLAEDRSLVGVVTGDSLLKVASDASLDGKRASDLAQPNPIVAYPDEPLRAVVYRMADKGVTRVPVVERGNPRTIVGMISLRDLLMARSRNLEDERRRERVIKLRMLVPKRFRRSQQSETPAASSS